MSDIWDDSDLVPEEGRIILTSDKDYYSSYLDWNILFPIKIVSAYGDSQTKEANFKYLNKQG